MPNNNYFLEMGKLLASEVAKHASTRKAADSALTQHLGGGRMATDGMPRSMRPRGGRDEDPDNGSGYAFGGGDPNGGGDPDANCIDSESCLLFTHKLLSGLPPEEQQKFLEGLANLLQSDDAVAMARGMSGTNGGALDARRRRGGRDNMGGGMPPSGMDRGRRPAMDSNTLMLNAKGFEARWGKLTRHVENWGR